MSGQIKSITDFGIFIGLDGGIDGLIHLSDISWNSTGETSPATTRRATRSEPVVLAVDPSASASAGVKQLEQDPLASSWPRTKGHQGRRHRQGSGRWGATIDLGDGVEGYVMARDISDDRVDDASQVLKVGQEVEAKFVAWTAKGAAACSCRSRRRTRRKP